MNAAPSTTQQQRSDKPFICARCHQPSATAYMCEKCAEATDPTRRKQSESLLWYEPKTNKDRRSRERREKKTALKPLWEILQDMRDADENERLAPGWTERMLEFLQGEYRRDERLAWLNDNWSRKLEVIAWRDSLVEQDSARMMSDMLKGGSVRPIFLGPEGFKKVIDADQIKTMGRAEDIGWVYEAIEQEQRDRSREIFFSAVYGLNDEDFAALQVRVHQLRVWRDDPSGKLAYTDKTAAQALSIRMKDHITEDSYKYRVEERLPKHFGADLKIWVGARYL